MRGPRPGGGLQPAPSGHRSPRPEALNKLGEGLKGGARVPPPAATASPPAAVSNNNNNSEGGSPHPAPAACWTLPRPNSPSRGSLGARLHPGGCPSWHPVPTAHRLCGLGPPGSPLRGVALGGSVGTQWASGGEAEAQRGGVAGSGTAAAAGQVRPPSSLPRIHLLPGVGGAAHSAKCFARVDRVGSCTPHASGQVSPVHRQETGKTGPVCRYSRGPSFPFSLHLPFSFPVF